MTRKWILIAVGIVVVGAWAWWRVYAPLHDVRELHDEAVALARLFAESDVQDLEHVLTIPNVRGVTIIDEHMRVATSSEAAEVTVTSEVRTALIAGKMYVSADGKGAVTVAVPSPRGGGVVLSMRRARRAPTAWSSVGMYLIVASLIGYTARAQRRVPATVETKELAPSASFERRAFDISCVERMMNCALVMVDEGRRVVAAGERGAALIGSDPARTPHLIDVIDADDVQTVLALVRRTSQDDGACVRIRMRGHPHECAAFAMDEDMVLAFRPWEEAV